MDQGLPIGQPLSFVAALVNMVVSCTRLLNGALEILRLRLPNCSAIDVNPWPSFSLYLQTFFYVHYLQLIDQTGYDDDDRYEDIVDDDDYDDVVVGEGNDDDNNDDLHYLKIDDR